MLLSYDELTTSWRHSRDGERTRVSNLQTEEQGGRQRNHGGPPGTVPVNWVVFFSENLPLELPLRHLRWWQWCLCRICRVSRHSKSHCWSTGRCPANLVFAVKHLHIILDSIHFDLLCISFLIIIPPVVWIVHVGMGTSHSHRDRAPLHSWLPRAPTCIKNLVSHLFYRHRHLTSPPWCHP